MKILKIKNQNRTNRSKARLRTKTIEFIQERETFSMHDYDKSKINEKELDMNFSQKIVYDFSKENVDFIENKSDLSNQNIGVAESHKIEKREFPAIDLPYRTLGISSTMNCQKFTSVYDKWTYCDVRDQLSLYYSH